MSNLTYSSLKFFLRTTTRRATSNALQASAVTHHGKVTAFTTSITCHK
ncbi:MAG: hypothetical protein NT128_01040 [Proteobacteria bacterium]|nr:hypothetical protein [Pseudomonadota bacterium]